MESYLNGSGLPNCKYESHVVHFDNITIDDSGSKNDFVTHLRTPIKDVVTAEMISCSMNIPAAQGNVCYVVINELSSAFNTKTGNVTGNTITSDQVSSPFMKVQTQPSSRTTYKAGDYPAATEFIHPIERLSSLSVRLLNQNGTGLVALNPSDDNVFFTLRFVCMRQNLCSTLEVKDLKGQDYRGAAPKKKRPVIYYYE